MTVHPSSDFSKGEAENWRKTYKLLEALCGSQASRSSTNDQHIDGAELH